MKGERQKVAISLLLPISVDRSSSATPNRTERAGADKLKAKSSRGRKSKGSSSISPQFDLRGARKRREARDTAAERIDNEEREVNC
jgi:hypothetical protein